MLVKVCLLARILEVVPIAHLVHQIVLSAPDLSHRDRLRCAFQNPLLLDCSRISVYLLEWIIMLDHLRGPGNLLYEIRHDLYCSLHNTIFCFRVVVELIVGRWFGSITTRTWNDKLVFFEDVTSLRIPRKVDLRFIFMMRETFQFVWTTLFGTFIRVAIKLSLVVESMAFIFRKLNEAVFTCAYISRQLTRQLKFASCKVVIVSYLGYLDWIDNEPGELRVRRMLDKVIFLLTHSF